jgi:hypothetical protein
MLLFKGDVHERRKLEVNQPNISLRVEHDVFRFQISVDNAMLVQMRDGINDLGEKQLDPLL